MKVATGKVLAKMLADEFGNYEVKSRDVVKRWLAGQGIKVKDLRFGFMYQLYISYVAEHLVDGAESAPYTARVQLPPPAPPPPKEDVKLSKAARNAPFSVRYSKRR